MNLMQCVTCGASDFTNGKCDYCRNQYEVDEEKIFYDNLKEDDSSLDVQTQDQGSFDAQEQQSN